MTGGGQGEIELAEVHVRVRSPSASPTLALPTPPSDLKQHSQPLMDRLLESLPPTAHFAVLASCVFLFFGAHNYLQEGISRMEGFEGLGSMLGYLEVVGVMVCSFFERRFVGETTRKVSFYDYMQVRN
jgi:hypothetical protein